MSKKIRICFVLPEGLQQDLRKQMVTDGYSLKGKSLWVSESVERLFNFENYIDLVKVNDEMTGFEKTESILIDKGLKAKIDESIINVRRKYPELDGVQSRIMRTAILQRLL